MADNMLLEQQKHEWTANEECLLFIRWPFYIIQ